ncbi:18257_t:CDS:2, partial [Funneliformis geosporum]
MLPEVTVISKEMVSENGQNNNTIDSNTNTMKPNTSEAPFGNIQISDSVIDQLNNEVGRVTSESFPAINTSCESDLSTTNTEQHEGVS